MALAPHAPASPAPLRIVVADDNRDLAETIAQLLEVQGHDVRTACDGRDAVALVERHRPQLAVLDLGMPGLSGLAVARAIRAQAWGRHVWLIALTGFTAPDTPERARAAGFDRHLTKPVGASELMTCVRALAGGAPPH